MNIELNDKGYRDEYVAESVRNGVAYQIRALRQQREWSQAELGRRSGKAQNVISRLENPDYGSLTISTLLDIAAAFDVGLIVKFASFREVMVRMANASPKALSVASFEVEAEQERIRQQFLARERGNAESAHDASRVPSAARALNIDSGGQRDRMGSATASQFAFGQMWQGGAAEAAAA